MLAQHYNEQVILLGDDSNRCLCSNWEPVAQLKSERFEEFKRYYVHLSPNGYDYELFCFERYFLLEQYVREHDLTDCIMLDSDACTYTDYSRLPFREYDAAASWLYEGDSEKWMIVPHVLYWKRESLFDFTDFLIAQYRNHVQQLIEKKHQLEAQHATHGISDMSLLYLWVTQRCGRFWNLAKARNGETFDVIFNTKVNCDGNDFKMIHGVKKVVFCGEVPYFETITGEMLKANVIHAQGERKKYIHMLAKYRYGILYLLEADAKDNIIKQKKRIKNHISAKKNK